MEGGGGDWEPPMPACPPSEFADLTTGMRARYITWGASNAPTIVLLHGNSRVSLAARPLPAGRHPPKTSPAPASPGMGGEGEGLGWGISAAISVT